MKDKTLATIGIVSFVVIIGVIFLPDMIENFMVKQAATRVLDNVIESNYDKAFENVYYFDRASDLEPTISYKDAKNQWIERIEKLEQNGIYIKDYSNLRVWQDDGYPRGKVNLTIMKNGEEIQRDSINIWFAKNDEDWKLGGFEDFSNDLQEAWELALSGKVSLK